MAGDRLFGRWWICQAKITLENKEKPASQAIRAAIMGKMRTQVGIVGAGPAGLFLAHLLHLTGIEAVIVEAKSRRYVEERIRAGVLEQGVRDLLIETGVGERMKREGLLHHGINLKFGGEKRRIDFSDLADGGYMGDYE